MCAFYFHGNRPGFKHSYTWRFLSWGCLALLSLAALVGCGSAISAPPPLSIQLNSPTVPTYLSSAGSLLLSQAGTPIQFNVAANQGGVLNLSVTGLPAGVAVSYPSTVQNSFTIAVTDPAQAPSGDYHLLVTASLAGQQATASQPVTIAIAASLQAAAGAPLGLAMSTAFQPADWDYPFFQNHANAPALLAGLQPQHIRLQAIDGAVPETAPGVWDFTKLDAIVQPVLGVGDHSPEFQIAVAPAFMYDANGNLLDQTFQQFGQYCQQLVEYYAGNGFTDAQGVLHQSPSPDRITWWGIFNEPNINHLTAQQYTRLYNTVVPMMQAAVPGLHFVAVELADFGSQPQDYLPAFVSGVTAPVDAVATHYYATCNQQSTDQELMNAIPQVFDAHLAYIRSELQTNPALAAVPIWVTENNVNADYSQNGVSACNGGPFTLDLRGSSAFFAGWRGYEFAQFVHAGAAALYHWDFDADAQFGEVNYDSAQPYLSYWVDQALSENFPPGARELAVGASETGALEILAAQRADGSIAILLANHAVAAAADNNGPGAPKSVLLDLSALGALSSIHQQTFDASTPAAGAPLLSICANGCNGPSIHALTLNGYGMQLWILQP